MVLGRFLRSLFKGVKHEDRFRELRDIQHAIRASDSNTDFSNAGTDVGHRLPVTRLKPLLNAIELKARALPRIRRECT